MQRITLLGAPGIVAADGTQSPVRGLQSWAVLARVLLSERPVPRRQIAEELFPETADPLGALRWCLAALRRALGPAAMTGDPIVANLPEGVIVDALTIEDEGFDPLGAGDLLDGAEPAASGSDFEMWLLVERTRIAARIDARLRRDALAALAKPDPDRALLLARHAVRREPFDEARHILLVRALVLSGDAEAARAHVEHVEADFRRELGEPPSPALRSAARPGLAGAPPGTAPATVVETLLDAGTAALAAGAADAGVDCLRHAAAGAEALDDDGLRARCLAELGVALIHAVRGHDDEGMVCLRLAETLAMQVQSRAVASRAVLERAYADALAGRRPDARALVAEGIALAGDDAARLAQAHSFDGFNLADWGRYDAAFAAYDRALAAAEACGGTRREIWVRGIGAWGQLRAGRAEVAEDWARRALALCDRERWLSFRPWPEAVLAELRLDAGEGPAAVRAGVEAPLAMARQLGDPCWEAALCRVTGLAYAREGQAAEAMSWLQRAASALTAVTDPYAALLVRILLDQARIAATVDREGGEALLRRVLELAVRTHAEAELEEAIALRARVKTSR